MITETYRTAGAAKARYVGKGFMPGEYRWCEQSLDDARYDVAQGTCDAEDLPDDVRKKCDEHDGAFYACEWPMK